MFYVYSHICSRQLTICSGIDGGVATAIYVWALKIEYSVGRHWEPHVVRVDREVGGIIVYADVLVVCYSILHNIEEQITISCVQRGVAVGTNVDEHLSCSVWYDTRYTDGVGGVGIKMDVVKVVSTHWYPRC